MCVAAKLPGHVDGGHDHSHDHSHSGGFVQQDGAQLSFEQPQRARDSRPVVAILFDDRVAPAQGSYVTNFETEDGVRVSENGQPGTAGQSNVEGSYS